MRHSNPYETTPTGREGKLAMLAQLNDSDAGAAQADAAKQNAMLEQISKLYGIQQQQQILPEHLRGLQLANDAEAARLGYMPQQQQQESAINTAKVAGLDTERQRNAAELAGIPGQQGDAHAEAMARLGLVNQQTVGLASSQPELLAHERAATERELAGPGNPIAPQYISAITSGQDTGPLHQQSFDADHNAQKVAIRDHFDRFPAAVMDQNKLGALYQLWDKPTADMIHAKALTSLPSDGSNLQNPTDYTAPSQVQKRLGAGNLPPPPNSPQPYDFSVAAGGWGN